MEKHHIYAIASVLIVALVGFFILFGLPLGNKNHIDSEQYTATAPGIFGEAFYNNYDSNNPPLVMCGCGNELYCEGCFKQSHVDCSCCLLEFD